jgi:CBS domain-containing protein
MASTVSDIMATDVETLAADAPISEAARRMRDADVGDVIVREGG